jgi:hypothetical protein
MVTSIAQSMRVEGYPVSEEIVRAEAQEVFVSMGLLRRPLR